jgi:hypothetical protein
MDKLHFIEGDTDSMYWAVSGKMTDDLAIDQKQNYQYVIKDLEFYDKHVYE